jgi:hypothetical protein
VLECKIGGIECKHADPPVMMPTMCTRSSIGAVGYASTLEHDALTLDRTCVKVRTKNAAGIVNQAKNKTKRKEKSLLFFIFFINILETRRKENKL